MDFSGLSDFISAQMGKPLKGSIAVIFIEDDVEVESTLAHHVALGFHYILVLGQQLPPISDDILTEVITISYNTLQKNAVSAAINHLMPYTDGAWVFTCFNAEYLYFPFSETRNFNELVSFHAEERRDSMLCYVVDIYAGDLSASPNGVDRLDPYLDKSGYYALARWDAKERVNRERQQDFFGGLKWRFEEFVPPDKRRIDRIGIFRAKQGLTMRDDFTFSDQEYNTYSCPWHNNVTAAIVSFRIAKALRHNPLPREHINDFKWFNSVRFTWSSQQLLDLGLIEPGQWF